ncbi:hypothetical protein [Streptomyces sp. CB02414]|uniref:hypothetical protein n=2 Tax=Streptomyces TaxID=1883 RepID=UPI0011611488|nr:hypothetical protein [Streptomyces sp. CB02414]
MTMVVLVVDGTAFEPSSPVLPTDPCPASAASGRGIHPTTYTEDAKPYAGPGPHPVHLRFRMDETLPPHWTTPDNEPYTAQLVVCEYVEPVTLTDIKCDYRGYGEVRLIQVQATYLLLEAKTSKLITRFVVEGQGRCPGAFHYSPDDRPAHVREDTDPEKIIKALRPYVEGAARQGSPRPAVSNLAE